MADGGYSGSTLLLHGNELRHWPIVDQVLHTAWTFERLGSLTTTSDGFSKFLGRAGKNPNWHWGDGSTASSDVRTVTIILYDFYQPEEIRHARPAWRRDLRARVGLAPEPALQGMHRAIGEANDGGKWSPHRGLHRGPETVRINQLIHGLGTASRRQVSYLPIPESRLFAYMLQRYGILSLPGSVKLFWGCTKNRDSAVSVLAFNCPLHDRWAYHSEKLQSQDSAMRWVAS